MDIFEQLRSRGLVHTSTPGLAELLAQETRVCYIGFDPSARSLHVGSLLAIMVLVRLQRAGHRPVAIVGGGTGLIGDPSGKSKERNLLTEEQVGENLHGIGEQLSRFLDFESRTNGAIILNNGEWLRPLPLLDFLRDIAKHFTVNAMVKMESVKTRLEREDGLSFTEFTYSLLQAYDYLVLQDRFGCRLQLGGSDQWGNIVMGIDLIRRLRGVEAHGLVFPLVTTSAGHKFGKTEAGTVWLSPELTSPFRFYQFFINTDDRDVGRFLRYFTQLDEPQISELEQATEKRPERREAQRQLAAKVTELVHGQTELAKAVRASNVLFGHAIEDLTAREIADIFADVPASPVPAAWLDGTKTATDLAVESGFAASRGEARRLIQSGGFYINNRRVTDPLSRLTSNHTIEGRYVVLRKGLKHYYLITLQE